MDVSTSMYIMQQAMTTAIKLAAPLLLVSMGAGLVISIIQAATQIHEQTITYVPKLLLIALVLLAMGSFMMESMIDLTQTIFKLMLE